jgi:membrane associated rhomboid family serine protease
MTNHIQNKKQPGFFSNLTITTKLIILNVIIFLIVDILSSIYGDKLVFSYLALTPSNIIAGKYLWTLITHMFLHANFLHLFFNMFSLWFIGKNVEKIIGYKRFIWFYLISGIVAGLFFSILSGVFGLSLIGSKLFGNPTISGVGASGAIFGLLGMMAVLVPRTRIYLIAGPLIALVVQAILGSSIQNQTSLTTISFVINLYILLSIFSIMFYNQKIMKIALPIEMRLWVLPIVAIVPLIIIGLIFPLPIANTAHLGGLIAGLVFGYYLRVKYKNKVRVLQRIFK